MKIPLPTTPRERHREHDKELRDLQHEVDSLIERLVGERNDVLTDYGHVEREFWSALELAMSSLSNASWQLRTARRRLP